MSLSFRSGFRPLCPALLALAATVACGDSAPLTSPNPSPPATSDDAGEDASTPSPDASTPDANAPKPVENTDALCSNKIDDDGNGYIDCDDYGCSRTAAVTVCNLEFYKPLPSPVTNAKPFSSSYLEGADGIAWSPKGRLFVGAGVAGSLGGTLFIDDGHLLELDPATAAPLGEIATAPTAYVGLAVSPDSRFVAGGTRAGGVVDVVDISSAPVVTTQSHAVCNQALAFSNDSRFLYAGGTESYFDPPTVERYDLTLGTSTIRSQDLGKAGELWELQASGSNLTGFTDEGIASLDPSTLAINKLGGSPPPAGAIGVAIMGAKHVYYSANTFGNVAISGSPIVSAQLHPNYRTAAVLQADGTLRLVDTVANKVGAPVQAHAKLGSAVAFSPDGVYLVSTGISPAVAIYRLK